MIVFNLNCNNEHKFEGWFSSSADFEQQEQSGLLSCPLCGNTIITKALHAPRVNMGAVEPKPASRKHNTVGGPPQYANVAADLAQMIEHLIANTDDVGDAFPEEARKIHYQETPERRIRGNASNDEVHELREEGIDVLALPIPKHLLGKAH